MTERRGSPRPARTPDADEEPSPGTGAGDPDGWERLWTPHRMAYIERGDDDDRDGDDGTDCPFCTIPAGDDATGLVVARGTTAYAVLNLYPYNAGHLMVVPYRHVADYIDTTADEAVEIAAMTKHAMAVLRRVSSPHGFNIGINQGATAGAGIAGHLHQHLVPRWSGDANFMPVIGHTKVLPQLLADTRGLLADAW